MSCRWFWDGLRWVESPLYPHFCLGGGTCTYPEGDGEEYGEERVTGCA